MTVDGKVDHSNFADKPVTTVAKKAATKKNVFFSDSDESDEQDSKPLPKPKVVAKPAPSMREPSPPKVVVPEPQPVV